MTASHALLAALTAAALLGAAPAAAQQTATAVFAGGCFWCVEADFDKVEGVLETVSGYSGGTTENPTYEEVTFGDTGHYEVVQVVYDPDAVSYEELLSVFWHSVDPTDPDGQFCDRGESYRTAVFVEGPEQREAAEASREAVAENLAIEAEIVTPILEAAPFWPAEEYHQDYYLKNPIQYNFYRFGCGRDARLDQVWGENARLGIR